MAIKKKKTKKAPVQNQGLRTPDSSAQKPTLPGPAGIGTSVGTLFVRVKTYFIPGKTAEA